MSKYFMTLYCAEDGCKEFCRHGYRTKAERIKAQKSFQTSQWKCIRHNNPCEVLGKDNLIREFEVINAKSSKYTDLTNLFWVGGGQPKSGFIYGLNWQAFADDFPPGTKIRGKIEVILPEEGKLED